MGAGMGVGEYLSPSKIRPRPLLDVAGMRSSARGVARMHGETRWGARGVKSTMEGGDGARIRHQHPAHAFCGARALGFRRCVPRMSPAQEQTLTKACDRPLHSHVIIF